MKRIALINGKVLDISTNTQQTLNIVISNTKIIGLGYIPDDEDSSIIDISGCIIIPGITLEPYENTPVLNQVTLQNPSQISECFNSESQVIVTTLSGSELLYAIQCAQEHKKKLHILIQNPTIDLPIINQEKATKKDISAALDIQIIQNNLSVKNALQALYEENVINGITVTEKNLSETLDLCLNELTNMLPISDIVKLLTFPSQLHNTKTSLGLLSTPSFHVIAPNQSPSLRLTISKGKMI